MVSRCALCCAALLCAHTAATGSGHATLATAHALLEGGHVDDSVDELSFDTLSGELRVARVADGALRLDLPLGAPDEALGASIDTAPLFAALGVTEPAPRVESVAFCARTRKLLVEVASVGTVLAARSDPAALLALRWPAGCDVRGVILTARTTDDDERAAHDDALIVSRCKSGAFYVSVCVLVLVFCGI